MAPAPEAHRRLIALAQGYQTAALLIAYAELGIADQLTGGPRTAAEIAQAVGAEPAAVARLLAAAEALGLAARSGDAWQNTPLSEETLVSDSPRSLVNFLRHQGAFYRRWSWLAEAVRTGRRPEENRQDEAAGDWVRNFTLMLYDIARIQAPSVAATLSPLLAELPRPPRIIDVGGGASTLVDDLLAAGFQQITVLDIAAKALEFARERLGARAAQVTWIETDVTQAALPAQAYALWHDRAVFHFLTQPTDRQRYIENARRAVRSGGSLILATFAQDGPERCSGLEVMRYSAERLQQEFCADFEPVESLSERHRTPFGTEQKFLYCLLRRR